MAIFRDRLPSGPQLLTAFVVCVFITHIWSIYNVLQEVPAWILYMNIWELLGGIAYTQLFALVDSLLLLAGVVALGFILPRRWFLDRFVAQGSLAALVVSAWAVLAHTQGGAGNMWSVNGLLLGFAAILVAIAVGSFLIQRFKKLETALSGVAERLVVLSFIYLALDALSIVIIVLRNV